MQADAQKLEPGLWLGSDKAASNKNFLKQEGISCLLVCASELQPHFPGEFTYKKLQLRDKPSQDLSLALREGPDCIKQWLGSGERVLVHCAFGLSRSAIVVLGFLVRHRGLGFHKALRQIERVRRVNPNASLLGQAKQLLRQR